MATKTALRLEKFHCSRETYPASLEELIPDYLSEVPMDPFGDGPLMYRRTEDGYLLYSFGYNRKDDNGLTYDDTPDMSTDDIRFLVGPLDSINNEHISQ